MNKKQGLGIVIGAEVVAAGLAWRDLGRRPSEQVRGPKKFWRLFVSLNPGNSVIYWLVGRRRTSPSS
jgi:hypothetical protein